MVDSPWEKSLTLLLLSQLFVVSLSQKTRVDASALVCSTQINPYAIKIALTPTSEHQAVTPRSEECFCFQN